MSGIESDLYDAMITSSAEGTEEVLSYKTDLLICVNVK